MQRTGGGVFMAKSELLAALPAYYSFIDRTHPGNQGKCAYASRYRGLGAGMQRPQRLPDAPAGIDVRHAGGSAIRSAW